VTYQRHVPVAWVQTHACMRVFSVCAPHLGARVADGDCGIPLVQQHRHWHAHDVGTTNLEHG